MMHAFTQSRFRSGRNALLRWVLILAMAVLPVDAVLAGLHAGCDSQHTASVSMPDMPEHDMNAMAEDDACCCCHAAGHAANCGQLGCGMVHSSVLMVPETFHPADTVPSLPADTYRPIHSGLFAQSLYRPPQA